MATSFETNSAIGNGLFSPMVGLPSVAAVLRDNVTSEPARGGVKWPAGEIPSRSRIIAYGSPVEPWDDIYREMIRKDPFLLGQVQRFIEAAATQPSRICPGRSDDTDGAIEAKDMVLEFLRGIDSRSDTETWSQTCTWLLFCFFSGAAFSEVNYVRQAGVVFPTSIELRPNHAFGFKYDNNNKPKLHYRSSTGGSDGLIEAPDAKFMQARHHIVGATPGPWGYGVFEGIYWSFVAKLYALISMSSGIEKFAYPTIDYEYDADSRPADGQDPNENREKEERIRLMAQHYHSGGELIHDNSVTVKPLWSQIGWTGAGDILSLVRYLDSSITLAILREVTTSGQGKSSSPLASMQVTTGISETAARVPARTLEHAWNKQFHWWTAMNLPGATPPVLKIDSHGLSEWQRKLRGFEVARENGIEMSMDYARSVTFVPTVEPGDEVLGVAPSTFDPPASGDPEGDPEGAEPSGAEGAE